MENSPLETLEAL